jgi:hypothetical protein
VAETTRAPGERRRTRWTGPAVAAVALLWLAWLVVPAVSWWGAIWSAATLFGEPPSAGDLAEARRLGLIGGAAAIGAPLAGLVLTWRARSRSGSFLFGVAALLGVVATFAVVGSVAR